MKQMIKRKDGSYSQRGLWDNVRANKGSGNKPTKEMLKQEAKIKAKKYGNGGPEDEETPDPPFKKNIFSKIGRLLGITRSFAPEGTDISQPKPGSSGDNFKLNNISDDASATARARNRRCKTSEECKKQFGRNAGSWAKDNSPGMGGKDTQSGGKPEPLEVTNANKELAKLAKEDLKYKDVVQYNRQGEPYVIRGEKYPLGQRIKNLWTGTEPGDQGGVSRGARNQMQYVDPNAPVNTNMGTKEEPLGTLNWPMNYSGNTSGTTGVGTTVGGTETTRIPMRPIASQEKPKFQLPNFMMNKNTDTDMHPNREDFEKSQAMNVKPKFQKAPDFKKGGFKNKGKKKSSFIEASKEIRFGDR